MIVGSDSSVYSHSGGGLGRAIVGGAVAGPVGAIVGAATSKQTSVTNNYTTFAVYYMDHHREMKRVQNDTREYKEYLSKLKVADDQIDPAEMIKRYKELLDAGAITRREYEQKKQELLGASIGGGE